MAKHVKRINPRSDWVHIRKFFASIDTETGCWIWLGKLDSTGRGHSTFRGWHDRAHRNAFRLFHGPIPADYTVCHSCDNPACVNPRHLWLGTHAENIADMQAKGRSGKGKRVLTVRERQDLDTRIAEGMPRALIARLYNVSYQYVCNRAYVTRRAKARPADSLPEQVFIEPTSDWDMG